MGLLCEFGKWGCCVSLVSEAAVSLVSGVAVSLLSGVAV